MSWWLTEPIRLVQTNLREIDIDLDPAGFVAELVDFSANVVLFNVGGIVANYPTELEYHYPNPHLPIGRGDILGEVIDRCHEAGIRFMARFDFSKVHESLAARRPEWLYVSEAGKHNNYNGQVQTCVSGGYQQEYCLKILSETIARYRLDAVFFNMTGYQRDDYDRNYLGICQCDACQTSFHARTGMDLPPTADTANPAFLALERFSLERTNEQYDQINRHVKALDPNIAICTYTSRGVDIWRKEAATTFERNLEWEYESADNVKSVMPAYPDKAVANAAVHFVSRRFRYSGVAPELSRLRLVQNIACAAPLDFFVIGTLGNQKDRVSYDGVRDLFHYHAQNAHWYQDVEPLAEVCLIKPEANFIYGAKDEYYGILRILSENHILYDVWPEDALEIAPTLEILSRYKTVIVGEARCLRPDIAAALDAYVASGGVLITTGQTATLDQNGRATGGCGLVASGINAVRDIRPRANSAYFSLRDQDKARLDWQDALDVVFLYGEYMDCELKAGAEAILSHLPPHMHGPPEKCYHEVEADDPGLIVNRHGAGCCVTIPWAVGSHYQTHGNHAHAILMNRVLATFAPPICLSTDAPALVEVHVQARRDGRWMVVTLVNQSGQNGHAFHAPVPMHDIMLKLKAGRPVARVSALKAGLDLPLNPTESGASVTVPRLDRFETLIFHCVDGERP
ncbi:MAG: family 10 glycosylhydrolase [Marinovum algicola]|uniref:Beta-galactosidase trimerisation domain-containing protein n=1 Tax=Marinovum algicola TaxID=42444 RepID=A0A975WCC5_9RHOB|nr:alpha-amylase family protein [Marinovum algicola]SEJ89864.1 Beta-galactosidase trimerisation domain-containing protein [Marinovum algicola]SLN45204.1 Beta-galactosidase trimerization domain protein [Marinovum algicola]